MAPSRRSSEHDTLPPTASEIPMAQPLTRIGEQALQPSSGDNATQAKVVGIFEDWDETNGDLQSSSALEASPLRSMADEVSATYRKHDTTASNLPAHADDELDRQPDQYSSVGQRTTRRMLPRRHSRSDQRHSFYGSDGVNADARHKHSQQAVTKKIDRESEPITSVTWDEPFVEPCSSIGMRLFAAMAGIFLAQILVVLPFAHAIGQDYEHNIQSLGPDSISTTIAVFIGAALALYCIGAVIVAALQRLARSAFLSGILFFAIISSLSGWYVDLVRTHTPGVHEQFVLQTLNPRSIALESLRIDKQGLEQQVELVQREVERLKRQAPVLGNDELPLDLNPGQ